MISVMFTSLLLTLRLTGRAAAAACAYGEGDGWPNCSWEYDGALALHVESVVNPDLRAVSPMGFDIAYCVCRCSLCWRCELHGDAGFTPDISLEGFLLSRG